MTQKASKPSLAQVKPAKKKRTQHKHFVKKLATNKPKKSEDTGFVATFDVAGLSHEGRGIATFGCLPEHQALFPARIGKKVFIDHALPHEKVRVQITQEKKRFAVGKCLEVIGSPSTHRVEPPCPHFGVCGGCQLQHMGLEQQRDIKQKALAEQLARANITPENWLAPVSHSKSTTAEQAISQVQMGYRRKVRLGVRFSGAKKLIIGFREASSNKLTPISECMVLHPAINAQLPNLAEVFSQLSKPESITHLEILVGEPDITENVKDKANQGDSSLETHATKKQHPVFMVVRHEAPFTAQDKDILQSYFQADATRANWHIFSQTKKYGQIQALFQHTGFQHKSSREQQGQYFLPDFGLKLHFAPTDFIQVNSQINQQMTKLACNLLDLKAGETALDLFCGLGNFTLAMAKQVGNTGKVVGIEVSQTMCQRAQQNARLNNLHNTQFIAQDLSKAFSKDVENVLENKAFDAILLDPPRAGAIEVMADVAKLGAKRIVYVSCDKATFVRDATVLLAFGYTLASICMLDMFPHTAHSESLAYFTKVLDCG